MALILIFSIARRPPVDHDEEASAYLGLSGFVEDTRHQLIQLVGCVLKILIRRFDWACCCMRGGGVVADKCI